MMSFLILGVILLGAILWFLLDRHEQRRLASGRPRHSGLRLVFAAAALLIMLFSGGCSLLFLYGWIADGAPSSGYVTWEAIAVLGGPPFAIGLLAWWLSMRRKTG